MSDTDSFIEEVTEEVRRDRVFGMIRKYGWIAVLIVLAIVGGAAWSEWSKATTRNAAEEAGDLIYSAVEADDNAARITALKAIDLPSPETQVIVDFLTASHQTIDGKAVDAAATLDAIAATGAEMPEIYRQIALFKSVTVQGADMPASERRLLLETLAVPGAPLGLLAEEQLALVDIEEGKADAALARLQRVVADAGVTAGLRRRATQLIVALGGDPSGAAAQGAGQ